MKIQTIFHMPSPYRDDFRVKAYIFGEGKKTLCIVGSMRGDEIQQQYVASRMVALLKEAEETKLLAPDISIAVIPSINPSSINVEKRFWALDGTDINRMFPGYALGETTQRIAAGVFEFIKDFKYGIQLASYYLPGDFLPHISMIRTGFEDVDDARLFGFPYVSVRNPEPFDTVLLNYNWQIWETKAFSLYAGTTETIDQEMAEISIQGICRFMKSKGFYKGDICEDYTETAEHDADAIDPETNSTELIDQADLISIQAPHAGIFLSRCCPGQHIHRGDTLAVIMHPYDGSIICEIISPADGLIFFARNRSITFQNTLLYRIIGVRE